MLARLAWLFLEKYNSETCLGFLAKSPALLFGNLALALHFSRNKFAKRILKIINDWGSKLSVCDEPLYCLASL